MQYFQTGEPNPERRRVYVHLVDATDGITPEIAEAGSKCKVSRNGGAPVDSRNVLVAIDGTNMPGDYYLELDSTELVHAGMLIVRYKSANTAEFVQICQVMAFDPYTHYGQLGSGGADIDYKKIRSIVQEAVDKLPKAKEPEVVNMAFHIQPVLNAIAGLRNDLQSIELPENDYSGIEHRLDLLEGEIKRVGQAVDAIEIPETDLTPVTDAVANLKEQFEPTLKAAEDQLSALLERTRGFMSDDVDAIKQAIAGLRKQLSKIPMVMMSAQPQAAAEEVEPINYDRLLTDDTNDRE